MAFLIANPSMLLQDVAAHYGVTQPWLSTMLHSDAFQAKFRPMQDQYTGIIFLGMREKMEAIAHKALDKLSEELELSSGLDASLKVTTSVLDRLGFSPKAAAPAISVALAPGTTVAITQVDASIIGNALELRAQAQELKEIKGEVLRENEMPQGVQPGSGDSESGTNIETQLHAQEAHLRAQENRNPVRGGVPQVGHEELGRELPSESLVEVLDGWGAESPVVPE